VWGYFAKTFTARIPREGARRVQRGRDGQTAYCMSGVLENGGHIKGCSFRASNDIRI